MVRSQLHRLKEIKSAIDDIQEFLKEMDEATFLKLPVQDRKSWRAICQCFTVIGAEINNLPSEIKDKYEMIDWQEAIGSRKFIVQQYSGIEISNVWKIIKGGAMAELEQVVSMEINGSISPID